MPEVYRCNWRTSSGRCRALVSGSGEAAHLDWHRGGEEVKDNEQCREAYNSLKTVLAKVPLSETEFGKVMDAMAIVYSRLPEAQ